MATIVLRQPFVGDASPADMNAYSDSQEARIWLIRPTDVYADLGADNLKALLDASEVNRLSRFRFKGDYRAYLVAHALRRLVLAEYLSTNPSEIVFGQEAKGRPFVHYPNSQRVSFSHSRTRNLIALAVSESGELGIDIEKIREETPDFNLLEKYVSKKNIIETKKLNINEKIQAFYLFWTVVEAHAKAVGSGLSETLPRLWISDRDDGTVEIRFPSNRERKADWSVFQFRPDAAHQAAVALRTGSRAIHLRYSKEFPHTIKQP